MCKKYYLEVVIRELTTTSTYERVDRECMNVVTKHKLYENYKIPVEPVFTIVLLAIKDT